MFDTTIFRRFASLLPRMLCLGFFVVASTTAANGSDLSDSATGFEGSIAVSPIEPNFVVGSDDLTGDSLGFDAGSLSEESAIANVFSLYDNGKIVEPGEYAQWRDTFESSASEVDEQSAMNAVPEPTGAVLATGLAVLVGLMTILRRRFDQQSMAPAPVAPRVPR